MALIFFDIITSIVQSIFIAYTVIYCLGKRINKIELFSVSIMMLFSSFLFTGTFGNNVELGVFLCHIFTIITIMCVYRKYLRSVLTSYTIAYSIIAVYSLVFFNLIFEYINGIIPGEYMIYEKIFIAYILQWIMLCICLKYLPKIKQIYQLILSEKFTINILIMSFALDFILTMYLTELSNGSQLIKNIINIIFFMVFIAISIYFWKIHQKSEQIYKLNEALEVKNSELSKIKHDYGAQISYLYGLCLMDRYDDLKKSLKDIINNNEATPTAVEVNENNNSILSIALKPAIDKGIHVIVEENCSFELIDMNEMELYRIISNIVNNAIKAMNGIGIIITKSYEYMDNVVIKIENNGPKIPENHLNYIFEVGFTTKENSDKSHGYGLSIVKDLVESHNGKIYVKSTDAATQFKIVLPIKQGLQENIENI